MLGVFLPYGAATISVMRFLIICFLSLFSVQTPKQADLETFRIRGFAQGTSYQINYYAKEELVTKQQIEQILSSIDSSLSIYKPYSLISQFNESQSGIKIDKHLKKVVKKSLEVSKKTGGAFDITIHPLVQAWGFGTSPIAALPDSASIHSLLKCIGAEKIWIHHNCLQKKNACVRIDVNGIAQGYTVDLMGEYLEAKGVENYLVELGGEIRIKGRKPAGGERMSIGIEGPGGDGDQAFPIQTIIRPENGAVTTSGNYRKFLQMGTNRISHLIDPKTGYPIRNEIISVTVWARDAITADAYDNALVGMGLEGAIRFAEQQKRLEAYFIYQKAGGSIADTATTGFYQLMK